MKNESSNKDKWIERNKSDEREKLRFINYYYNILIINETWQKDKLKIIRCLLN